MGNLKHIIVYILLTLSTQVAYAASFTDIFTEGLTWESEGCTTSYPPDDERASFLVTEWLGEAAQIDGRTCYKLMESTESCGINGNPVFLTYVYEEEGRVYYYDTEIKDWRLMYDFNLQPNEGTTVWWFNGTYEYDNIHSSPMYVVCRGIAPDSNYPDLTLMQIESYADVVNVDDTESAQHGQWLVGIGSTDRFKANCRFEMLGGDYYLTEVTYRDEIIYSSSGDSGIKMTHQDNFGTERLPLLGQDTEHNSYLEVYTIDGKKLSDISNQQLTTLPAGIYIIVYDNKSIKFINR